MEIINGNPTPQKPVKKDNDNNSNMRVGIFIGVILILAGVVWLLHSFDALGPVFFNTVLSWQMLMIVIGGYLLAVKSHTAGSIVGGLGLIFLLVDLCNIHMSVMKTVIPSAMIVVGISLILTRMRKNK